MLTKKSFLIFLVLLLIAVSVFFVIRNHRGKRYAVAAKTELPHYPYTFTTFDVGQGDAFLLKVYHKNILIDGGGRSSNVVSRLHDLGIDTLHWVIASHPHADHIGGLIPVFRSLPIVNVMDNGMAHTSQTYRNYRFVADSAASAYFQGRAGWQYTFSEDAHMKVLHPFPDYQGNINNQSLVVRFQLGESSVMFTGDIEEDAEIIMVQSYPCLNTDVLKIAHHGSNTSTSEIFLLATDPMVALVSCGANNRYGHPSAAIIRMLEINGISYFRTDQHGTITLLFDGEAFSVQHRTGDALSFSPLN